MNATIYKCFIGSPSDTFEERQLCKVVFHEINKTIGEKFNFRIESLMFEDDAIPGFGEDVQDVINRTALLGEYKVFIGIMWARFGTPTKRSESGTLEEFEDAYKKYQNDKNIKICMYFNKKDIPQQGMDPDQIAKVIEFKKRVTQLGGLYQEYTEPAQFKDKLRLHLTNHFLSIHDPTKNNAAASFLLENQVKEKIKGNLKERLSNALSLFKGHNPCWIDPIISNTNNISSNYIDNYNSRIDLDKIVSSPTSIIIKSPPQFGLTCLSHHLRIKAWENNEVWIYIDTTAIDKNNVEKNIIKSLKNDFNIEDISQIKCIILDSWKSNANGAMKILKNFASSFSTIPLIVMETIDPNNFFQEPSTETIEREFQVMHLLALPKTEIRKMVSSYNDVIYIAEEDKVVNKVVSDLDNLNIHRTPMNCLTLLKVSEKYFDEKTINRADMLEKVLYILFDLNEIPSYKSKPDLKDCEFILGIFCEKIIKEEKYRFTRNEFLTFSQKVCAENYIELDLNLLFDILYLNGIIIESLSEFTFRATYWLFYFGAVRMHASQEFANYIFETQKYINYPEIIEFYTGIDRRRSDALEILEKDLKSTCKDVLDKLGLPEHIDPYLKVEWNPSIESIEKARKEINVSVQTSKLPVQIKDQHSDASQNQLRAYDQGIKTILNEYSLAVLMRKITASSRALRNSDYARPEIKKELLEWIILSYEQVAKALMILTPELAINGHAAYGGQGFNLMGNFGDTIDDRINMILQQIPNNVILFFKDDIDSEKLGPLIINKIEKEKTPLNKHLLIILLVSIRPANWRITVENYIKNLNKNSFYLFDLMGQIRHLYFYDYIDEKELNEFKHLLLTGYSKHEFGSNRPPKHLLSKFSHSILKKPKLEDEEDQS